MIRPDRFAQERLAALGSRQSSGGPAGRDGGSGLALQVGRLGFIAGLGVSATKGDPEAQAPQKLEVLSLPVDGGRKGGGELAWVGRGRGRRGRSGAWARMC